jgi:hypothetical protein
MSSPKRAVKNGAKAAVKTVRRSPVARPSAKPKMQVVEGASADAFRAAAVIERSIVDGKLFTPHASTPASSSPRFQRIRFPPPT